MFTFPVGFMSSPAAAEAGGDLVTSNTNFDVIYIHDGISDTISSSFTSPGLTPSGLTTDGTDLFSSDGSGTSAIYRHSGVTSTITSSFATGYKPMDLAFDGTNIINVDFFNKKIIKYVGITSTVDTSFSTTFKSAGLTVLGGNLIVGDTEVFKIFVHSGITSTITDSFGSPSGAVNGLASSNDVDLLSVSNNNRLWTHSGLTSTTTSDFALPSTSSFGATIVQP